MKTNILLLSLPLALAKVKQKPIVESDPVAWELPRGLNPSLTDRYRPDAQNLFSCLSNNAHKLPFPLVNDDFCDCPDGSDEPGTAACSHINASVNPLPGFYCANRGHIPAYIPFNRINDGICDYEFCCDGSDEWMGVGGVKCENKCESIGKEARKVADEARRLHENGIRKYNALVERAVMLRKEVEDKIVTVDGELLRAHAIVEEKRKILEDAEIEEKSKITPANEGKGKNSQLIKFAKDRIEEFQDRAALLKAERDSLKQELEKAEKILETFKEEYNPNFNDEGVKRAVKAWEDYIALKPLPDHSAAEKDEDLQKLIDEEIVWEDWETPEEEETIIEEMYRIESYLPPPIRSWVHSQLSSLHKFLMENGVLAHRKPSSSTKGPSSYIQSLRDNLSDAESTVSKHKSRVEDLKKDLDKDYGKNHVFRALQDVCAEAASGEYTYSYCHNDKAMQKNRDGMGTHLGNWVGFDRRIDDDTEQEVVVIKYENGARCWNGPERSAYVYLRCSAEEKLLSVVEAEKCVYKFVATSPAVCGDQKPVEG